MNYFEFFDLPRHLSVDQKDLEKRFYSLSRKWHPDMFARKSAAEQQQALEATAILNDGYRTLKEPVARALYLLKLEGFDVGEQGNKDVPPELLEEVFELNMAIEEGDGQSLDDFRRRFETMLGESDTQLTSKFAEWDASQDRTALTAIRAILNRRKYITNLIQKTNVPDRV